ncbi:hypothetical protein IF1G_07710 [Cordyceps javanica]|uniref:Uncharacterized protein n=1 Tax=Cordyceps javanica TaxID=43265 RepID=A0A545UX15_9HYPO|nr:hypothetical protein IF1G_07710 [Cordyceps javanica]
MIRGTLGLETATGWPLKDSGRSPLKGTPLSTYPDAHDFGLNIRTRACGILSTARYVVFRPSLVKCRLCSSWITTTAICDTDDSGQASVGSASLASRKFHS